MMTPKPLGFYLMMNVAASCATAETNMVTAQSKDNTCAGLQENLQSLPLRELRNQSDQDLSLLIFNQLRKKGCIEF